MDVSTANVTNYYKYCQHTESTNYCRHFVSCALEYWSHIDCSQI